MGGASELVRLPVPAALTGLVHDAVGYRVSGLSPGVHLGMPSPHLTVVIDLGDGVVASEPGAFDVPASAVTRRGALVAGLHSRATRIHHAGEQRGIQLSLEPLGARALLGCPAAELAQRCLDLDDVWPGAEALRGRLAEAAAWGERARILFGAMATRVSSRSPQTSSEVVRAWRLGVQAGGALRVWALAADVGWSARRLQQRFGSELGLSPKAALSLVRFHVAHQAIGGGAPLAEAAAHAGYSDQAHLSRDWHAVTGSSITQWLGEDELAARG